MKWASLLRFHCLWLLVAGSITAQDTHFPPQKQLIPGPDCLHVNPADLKELANGCTAADYEAWSKDVRHWREERRIRIGYNGARYAKPELRWTQSSFIQPQMMVHDRFFFDPASSHYTVDRYLNDVKVRYGGIDSVLIWPTYPNMGIDDRNQQDMIGSLPGGIAGVKRMIADFHHRGVRVLFPMMMWDQGTRDPGKPWPQAIAELMRQLDADGINGDTQDGVPLAFTEAAEQSGHALAFEPEGSPSDEALAWNVLTWGQYSGQFGFVPGVDRFRWLEPRHQGISLTAGTAVRSTICSSPSSTARAGKAGRTFGASGTGLIRAMRKQRGGWRRLREALLRFWQVRIGSRCFQPGSMEFSRAAGR